MLQTWVRDQPCSEHPIVHVRSAIRHDVQVLLCVHLPTLPLYLCSFQHDAHAHDDPLARVVDALTARLASQEPQYDPRDFLPLQDVH